jgi:hypothetical protein
VATVHDAVKEMIRAHLTLVHIFHAIVEVSAADPQVGYTPYGA